MHLFFLYMRIFNIKFLYIAVDKKRQILHVNSIMVHYLYFFGKILRWIEYCIYQFHNWLTLEMWITRILQMVVSAHGTPSGGDGTRAATTAAPGIMYIQASM